MTIKDFIEELRQKEIEVSFSGGKLKYSGPEENITPELIEKLKKYKGKLIKYFWPKEFANLMPINTEGNKTPLFIVHGDNGNYIISEHLGTDQPVYGFFHPGSEGEEISFKSVEEMAKTYLDKILTLCPIGPYYLVGFSFGGTLAFEMSVQLQKAGHKVPFLVLIDSFSPLARQPMVWHNSFYKIVRKNILGPFRRKWERNFKSLICKCYILLNRPVPIKRRKFYLLNKYYSLTLRYSPAKFDGDILLFRATKNINSSHKYLGWETLVNGMRLIEIDGKHINIFEGKDNVNLLRTEIEKYLLYVSR
ncbi:MAG: thioesterase domain-containing protein [Bacteroidota bacterium]